MKRHYSAGGVVYKIENGQIKILLIATKNKTVWAFPKGHVESGEKGEETALREIKEETGIEGKIVDELGEVSYWFVLEGQKCFKIVKYFLVEYTGGEIFPQWEIDTAEWFSVDEALEKLTYKSDKEILKKAMEKILNII
ncbi:NUDIX hydrolase [Thermodesulfovibrio hydrogeniphilus]